MEDYINDSLSTGIICPSSSPAGAGFFFVQKKDIDYPCIDYQVLNDITVKNRYLLPLISSAFDLLEGATVFTKLDFRNTYHLGRIREGDEWKMAFNTPTGHYKYLVMPFGLNNAPAVFWALVNGLLWDMLNKFVFVYLDDILIFSKTREEHVHHIQSVLRRPLENSLFVKAEKCEFHAPSVSFLGYIIGRGNIHIAPDYQVGHKVWLSARDLPLWGNSKKLAPKFIGPFESLKIVNLASVSSIPVFQTHLPHSHASSTSLSVTTVSPAFRTCFTSAISPGAFI